MPNNSDFFGTPEENLNAARQHTATGRKGGNLAVPSRKEVMTLPPAELKAKLIAWMEHSVIEIVPSRGQIALVKDVLAERPDASKLADIIAMCSHYMNDA
ncbi:hypothetical protein H3H36_12990 [Duganella sp. FT3S]|uniref:Uncharacterized protein n=1 Tax=Rugamonas fusca TaxID=2758568 RepID=A0A7W2EHY4_9BURK|nr:hypothetical protein [Rugamonas fusca]MBA5606270.1 hypothetical protein [Rugamonas fusca]